MQNQDKLTGLIEQAACSITMLGPTDFSEMDGLQKTLDEIKQSIDEISDGPSELLAQAKGTADDANEALLKVLGKEVDDAKSSIDTISKAISSLQDLCGQIVGPDGGEAVEVEEAVEAEQAVEVEEAAEAETGAESSGGMCIAEDDVALVLDFVAESSEHLETAEAGLLELENKPDDSETLNQIFRGFHTIKGTAGFLNLTDIGSLAHVAENLLDMARKGDLVMAGEYTDVIFESMDMLKKMMSSLSVCAETGKPVPSQSNLGALVAKLEALATGQSASVSGGTSEALPESPMEDIAQPGGREGVAISKGQAVDEKIKVSTNRLDQLINMTGELVIAQLMVGEEINVSSLSDDSLFRNVAHQGKIIRDLQELSMSMRMVPISGVFQKMARLVRDLSRKAGKKVDFLMSGEDTELDRTIVDKIADPLVHMVRNSVDHGIESAEDRKRSGKNMTGRIQLSAFHQAGNIVIEIEDDGKGLDKDRILKKAISNGIVSEGQSLSDEEIFKLIFHAGLSTARKVTSVSGRGVGMDVVRKNIESLRGKIDISSTVGEGTVFTIRLPLTLAIIDGQVVKVGDNVFIVPINSIEQSLRPKGNQLSSVMGRGEMVLIRGELLPLVRMYELFGMRPQTEDPTKSLLVVVEEGNRRCCLLVDELLGQQQVVIKNLGNLLGRIQGVSGGAIMGDGRVRLILDIPGLMELSQN
jgi:two-component system chemotaxis sensor kinase CheA